MYRRRLGIAAFALAGLLLSSETASAQRGWRGGGYGGGYYSGPYGGAYYSGPYSSGSYNYGPYGRMYYGPNYYAYGPQYSSYGWSGYYGPRYYSMSGYDYGPRYYSTPGYDYTYGQSSYYSDGSGNVMYGSAPACGGYAYGNGGYSYGAQPSGMPAVVNVTVPPDATLTFDGTDTKLRGPQREFYTPALDPSKNFSYEVRASWKEDGREVKQAKTITVRAGERTLVDFTSRVADAGTEEVPSPKARRGSHDGVFVSVEGNKLVMTDAEGKRHTHTLAPDAEIIIKGQPGRAEDLKADMRIHVTTKEGDPDTATRIEVRIKSKARANPHEGVFVSVKDNQLVMTDAEGKRHTHTLAPDAEIIIKGQPRRAEDLRPDMRIRVTTREGDPNTATRIEVRVKQ